MNDFDFEMDLDSILAEFSSEPAVQPPMNAQSARNSDVSSRQFSNSKESGEQYAEYTGTLRLSSGRDDDSDEENNDTDVSVAYSGHPSSDDSFYYENEEHSSRRHTAPTGVKNQGARYEENSTASEDYDPEPEEDFAPVVPRRSPGRKNAKSQYDPQYDPEYAPEKQPQYTDRHRGSASRQKSRGYSSDDDPVPVRKRTSAGTERDSAGRRSGKNRTYSDDPERVEKRRRADRTSDDEERRERRERAARAAAEKGTETARKAVSGVKNFVLTFTGLVFGAGALIVLAWMLVNVHPDSSMASTKLSTKNRANIVTQLDSYANNAKGELLSDLTVIRKHYLIPEGDLVAPEAPAYNYGTTTDPKEVLAVIEEAREYGLLDGQNVVFNENVDFYYDSDIEYYCDETLLVICWKELIDNRICSCVEVKMADGSQIRRKLAEDTYGSSTYVYATELASQCNAVVAMNADYYAFRDLGVTVYNRTLYRFDDANYNGQYSKYNATDSLLIDSSGDFHIFHKGDTSTREAMEQTVADQNIMFSVAFGPVLVENGEQVWCDWYPVGEVDKEYSRAGIAQYDKLHYLYMTVSFADNQSEYHPRCTVNEFAALMAGKGVKTAYCLDGGQTGEVVFQGKPYNHIDFGTERTVSDIIYFATAIPESER